MQPDPVMLSAYLDGELTAAEQAEVEEWLARDPQARHLLDELRALGQRLQALPQQKVGRDLSEVVIETAERRILTGVDEPERARPASLWRSAGRTLFNRRALTWATVAAVLGVAILISDQVDLPRQRPPVAWDNAPREAPLAAEHGELPEASPAAPMTAAEPENAPASGFAFESNGTGHGGQAEAKPAIAAESSALELRDANSGGTSVAADEPLRRRMERSPSEHKLSEDMVESGERAWAILPQDNGEADAPQSSGPGEVTPSIEGRRALARTSGAKSRARLQAAPPGSDASIAGVAPPASVPASPPPPSEPIAARMDAISPAGGAAGQSPQQTEPGLLVVRADLTPEVAQKKVFDQMLLANSIVIRNESSAATEVAASADGVEKPDDEGRKYYDYGKERRSQADKSPDAPRKGGETAKRGASELAGASQGGDAGVAGRFTEDWTLGQRAEDTVDAYARIAGGEEVELVYVEATPAQIEATLSQMVAEPQNYRTVLVEPAPGVTSQLSLLHYNTLAVSNRGQSDRFSLLTDGQQVRGDRGAAPAVESEDQATPRQVDAEIAQLAQQKREILKQQRLQQGVAQRILLSNQGQQAARAQLSEEQVPAFKSGLDRQMARRPLEERKKQKDASDTKNAASGARAVLEELPPLTNFDSDPVAAAAQPSDQPTAEELQRMRALFVLRVAPPAPQSQTEEKPAADEP